MEVIKKVIKNEEELIKHIQSGSKSFYFSSQTSTVIPYDKIENYFKNESSDIQNFYMCDLSQLQPEMELLPDGNLRVKGAVSWKDAKEFLNAKGRNIKTAPTENLALINAGLATSCTGERCFMFGNLRSQVISCKYINYNGEIKELRKDKKLILPNNNELLASYQKNFAEYKNFKNAPFPRLETETDLMIGTEGQLGVIIESIIETCEDFPVQHLFILIPKWEEDYSVHIRICNEIQKWRNSVVLCELIDSNAFSYLSPEERPNQEMDAIFFEVKLSDYEEFYEQFISKIEDLDQEKVFELNASKFHHLRASVPRAVFEKNSEMGVTKMGTDVQVNISDFAKLLDIYQDFAKQNINYNLFGHFGDAHLHFNYMPKPENMDFCQKKFENMYNKCVALKASPFAEHGIGILKLKYMGLFHNDIHHRVFKELKTIYDPNYQFFPQGYLNQNHNSI